MGFHCSECVYATMVRNEETGLFQAGCSRGYTLTNPHVHVSPDDHFAKAPEELVPTVDPFGELYLRTSNVCERFLRPQDVPHKHESRHNFVRNILKR